MSNSQYPNGQSPFSSKKSLRPSQSIQQYQSPSKRQQIPGSRTEQQSKKSKSIVIDKDESGQLVERITQESSIKRRIYLNGSNKKQQSNENQSKYEKSRENSQNIENYPQNHFRPVNSQQRLDQNRQQINERERGLQPEVEAVSESPRNSAISQQSTNHQMSPPLRQQEQLHNSNQLQNQNLIQSQRQRQCQIEKNNNYLNQQLNDAHKSNPQNYNTPPDRQPPKVQKWLSQQIKNSDSSKLEELNDKVSQMNQINKINIISNPIFIVREPIAEHQPKLKPQEQKHNVFFMRRQQHSQNNEYQDSNNNGDRLRGIQRPQYTQNQEYQQPKSSWFHQYQYRPNDRNDQNQDEIQTNKKKAPYDLPVPKEQYQSQNQQLQSNQIKQFVIDDSQRRITDFVSVSSKRQPPKPSTQNDYKIVVKDASPQRQFLNGKSGLYKDNDIYGVESQKRQQQQIKTAKSQQIQKRRGNQNQDIQIDKPPSFQFQPSQPRQIQIDGPSPLIQGNSQIFINFSNSNEMPLISLTQHNIQSNKANWQSQRETERSNQQNKFEYAGNLVINQNAQTQSQKVQESQNDIQIDQIDRQHVTQQKFTKQKELTFFYSKKGDTVYTEQCYKEPLSQKNRKAVISQSSLKMKEHQLDKLQIQQKDSVSENQKSEKIPFTSAENRKDKSQKVLNGDFQTVQRQKTHPTVQTIYYREQEELNTILDYLNLKQQVKDDEQTKNLSRKQNKKSKDLNQEKKQSENKKQIKQIQIDSSNQHRQELQKQVIKKQPRSEQVEKKNSMAFDIYSFGDRSKQAEISNQKEEIKRQNIRTAPRKVTSKKQFKKVTINKQENIQSSQPDFGSKQKSFTSSKKHVTFDEEPKGSVFHFELVNQYGSNKKMLVQVRRSGRIFSKSKAKILRDLERVDQGSEIEIHSIKDNQSKSKNKSISKDKSKSKSKNKLSQKQIIETASSKSKTQYKSELEDEILDLDWLKQHISQLKQVVVDHAFMYDQYKAMTETDAVISNFLFQLEQRGKNLEKQQQDAKSNQVQKNQNQMMTRARKAKQNKAHVQQKNQSAQENKEKTEKNQPLKESQQQNHLQNTNQPDVYQNSNQQHQNSQNSQSSQNSQNSQSSQSSPQSQNRNIQADSVNYNSQAQRLKIFKQNKDKYKIQQDFPLTVDLIVDPDILNLGIYALIKLGRLTEFQIGTKYAITPICQIRLARKKNVKLVLEQSKRLVPIQYAQNIAWVALNSKLLKMIDQATQQKKKTSRYRSSKR